MVNYANVVENNIELNMGVSLYDLSQSELRALYAGHLMLDNNFSIRQCALNIGVGSTTIFRDIHNRLPILSISMYDDIMGLMKSHVAGSLFWSKRNHRGY